MFLNGLKVKSILSKIDQSVQTRLCQFGGKKPAHIGLLQHQDKPLGKAELNKVADVLDIAPASITVLTYVATISKEDKENNELLTNKHIGWSAAFKASHVQQFAQKQFDVLINYYEGKELSLLAVTALSKASFKIGIAESHEKLNDLTIVIKDGKEHLFTNELKKYLTILKIIK